VKTVLSVAATESEICVKITGTGSMRESVFLKDLILRHLESSPDSKAWVDLTECTYLDSTLLGCLIGISREAGSRFGLIVPPNVVEKIFVPTGLDRLLPISQISPPFVNQFTEIQLPEIRTSDLKSHLYECHARLAEVSGPLQPVFAKIADRMKKEMTEKSS
jgi:anti-anti-sigma factor